MEKPRVLFFLLFLFYSVLSVLLFLYSYTQVDLNLTLSQVSIWQSIQKSFQYIGYYERGWSTVFFTGIVIGFFILYAVVVMYTRRRILTVGHIWRLIFTVSALVILSYPAFSYDIFNYMFTAKTVAVYHLNPYTVIPLEFSGIEPWLSFMRWTHLPSAYTPFWIALTIPSYILGFGYFLPVLWNIKLLVFTMYILAVAILSTILRRVDKDNEAVGLAIFALNPLVIIETLVSAHNDIAMMTFALFSLYLYLVKKPLLSFIFFSLSIATKLMTIFLLPLYIVRWNRYIALLCMTIGLLLVLTTRDVLPWYFVWIMPFVALLPRSKGIFVIAMGTSFGLLLRYTPYLYRGNWDGPSLLFENLFTIASIVVAIAYLYRRKFSSFYRQNSFI